MGHANKKWTFEPDIPRKDEFMVGIGLSHVPCGVSVLELSEADRQVASAFEATGVWANWKWRKSKDSLVAGWWFGTVLIFQIYWEQQSRLTFIFFRGVETTNQLGTDSICI